LIFGHNLGQIFGQNIGQFSAKSANSCKQVVCTLFLFFNKPTFLGKEISRHFLLMPSSGWI
jgi:hypothetical protein